MRQQMWASRCAPRVRAVPAREHRIDQEGAAPIGGIDAASAAIDWGESRLPRAELAFSVS
ncbi:hypothetical protein FB472_0948 [Rhodoglobus vestalii]|uniref:Uncharacterized protein n=1 Tax=Rhodoglobus vestalii TaxID=193384 RepID=A0A8H2PUA3_9MICO|nr:hypothetical protein FB472_0948 [Rhodoglobus vestalii]